MMLSTLSPGEIAGVVTAVFTGVALVIGAVVKLVIARRPIDMAEQKREAKREEDESKRFQTQHATFETLLQTAEERFENEHEAHERTRGALTQKIQENGRLQEENGALRFEKLTLTERVETLEANAATRDKEIARLNRGLVECHEGHASSMADMTNWVVGELLRAGIRASEPPRLRSITPIETPAISSPTKDKPGE